MGSVSIISYNCMCMFTSSNKKFNLNKFLEYVISGTARYITGLPSSAGVEATLSHHSCWDGPLTHLQDLFWGPHCSACLFTATGKR